MAQQFIGSVISLVSKSDVRLFAPPPPTAAAAARPLPGSARASVI